MYSQNQYNSDYFRKCNITEKIPRLIFLESQEVSSLTSSERDSEKKSADLQNQFATIKNMLSTNEQGDRTKFVKREGASWHKNGKFDLGSIIEISEDEKFGTVKSEFLAGSFGNHSNSNTTNKNHSNNSDGLLSFGQFSSAEKQQPIPKKKNRKSLWGNPAQNPKTDSVQKNQTNTNKSKNIFDGGGSFVGLTEEVSFGGFNLGKKT